MFDARVRIRHGYSEGRAGKIALWNLIPPERNPAQRATVAPIWRKYVLLGLHSLLLQVLDARREVVYTGSCMEHQKRKKYKLADSHRDGH